MAAALVPGSRREPSHHLDGAAPVNRHAHQLAPHIAHLPPAVLLALDALVDALRGGDGRVILLLLGDTQYLVVTGKAFVATGGLLI
jgi:hypothetical protein